MSPVALLAFPGIAAPLPSGSSIAPRVDAVFLGLLGASCVIAAVLIALNLTFLIRYRRGSTAPRGPLRLPVWKIEAGWIAGTTLVFLGFFGWGAWVYLDLERPPAGALPIQVVARQWMWDVRQPNGHREFNTLHVPVGQPVRLEMTSEDVIHSFFVPAFRIKQDIVPGKTIATWFEATRPGHYHLFCSQYCGTEHAAMTGEVIALPPADYAAWLDMGTRDASLAAPGRRLFLRYGCSGCHGPNSTVHAPALEGLYGRLVALDGGKFVRADDAYLRDSILEPTKQITAGYPSVMPAFKGVIPEGHLLELIAYLKSLATETPPPPVPSQP